MIHGSGNGTNAMKVAQLQNLVGHLIFHIGVDAHFGSLVLRVLHHQSTKKMVPVDLLIPKTQKRTKTLKWKVIYCGFTSFSAICGHGLAFWIESFPMTRQHVSVDLLTPETQKNT